ncbi:MAG: hypothetical protein RR144_06120 [Clostridia bacterium]
MKIMKNENKLNIFSQENFDYINNLIESKIDLLHTCEDYNVKFKLLTNEIDALENTLSPQDKELFKDIIHLFYTIDDYYSIFSYSLGVKFANELKKL